MQQKTSFMALFMSFPVANWILGGNLAVEKSSQANYAKLLLLETTTFFFATCWLLSKAKAVQYSHFQQISAGKDRA